MKLVSELNILLHYSAAYLEQSHVRVEIESSEAHIPLPARHLAGGAEAGVRVGDLVTGLPEGAFTNNSRY